MPVNLGSCLEDSGCFLPKFALLLRSLLNSFLFSSFILSCLPFSSLLISSLVVASLWTFSSFLRFFCGGCYYSLFCFLTLSDPICPYLLVLLFAFPFFLFTFSKFSFFMCRAKRENQIRKHPHPLTMDPPRSLGPICLFPHPLYVQKESPA